MLPADKPKKNKKANRYDWSTWLVELTAIPTTVSASAAPPTIYARFWTESKVVRN
jgi:hypothetical protein